VDNVRGALERGSLSSWTLRLCSYPGIYETKTDEVFLHLHHSAQLSGSQEYRSGYLGKLSKYQGFVKARICQRRPYCLATLICSGTMEEMLETSLQALLDSTCGVHENMALMLLGDQGDKIPVFLDPVKPVNFDHQSRVFLWCPDAR